MAELDQANSEEFELHKREFTEFLDQEVRQHSETLSFIPLFVRVVFSN
jgi:hypothetical protein